MQPLRKGFQPEGGAADSHGETHRREASPVHVLPSILLPEGEPALPRQARSFRGESCGDVVPQQSLMKSELTKKDHAAEVKSNLVLFFCCFEDRYIRSDAITSRNSAVPAQ